MKRRNLGQQGLSVSAIGLGCMGLSCAYDPPSEQDALKLILHAFELGINFWDTAEMYGPYRNESLLGQAIKQVGAANVVIATKFGFEFNKKGEAVGVNSHPEHIKKSVEGSLQRLGVETIDLYYQHRLDPKVPIEETMQALANLVAEGKIKYIGLSELSVATIKRAQAIHPLSVIQTEYSIWERHVEEEILPYLKLNGIGFVAYSPLGRGFLSGKIQTRDVLKADDWRSSKYPRMNAENFQQNYQLVERLQELAESVNLSAAQLSLAWLLHQHTNIVPIPGTKNVRYLEENCVAESVHLSEATLTQVEELFTEHPPVGARYVESALKLVDQS